MLEGWEWIIILGFAFSIVVVIVVFFLVRNNKPQNIVLAPPPAQSYASNERIQKLEQMKIMMDRGLISKEDYEEQKKRILNSA